MRIPPDLEIIPLVCDNVKINNLSIDDYFEDGIGSYEQVVVGPEFGCIHWEKTFNEIK